MKHTLVKYVVKYSFNLFANHRPLVSVYHQLPHPSIPVPFVGRADMKQKFQEKRYFVSCGMFKSAAFL